VQLFKKKREALPGETVPHVPKEEKLCRGLCGGESTLAEEAVCLNRVGCPTGAGRKGKGWGLGDCTIPSRGKILWRRKNTHPKVL